MSGDATNLEQVKQLQRVWDSMGEADPLFAVLSFEDKKGKKWEIEEFFATGQEDVGSAERHLGALGIPLGGGRAVDFGCGVGRVTRALSGYFDEIWGVDVAPSMVRAAEELNRGIPGCRFILNSDDELGSFSNDSVDFVFSKITLQHIPPSISLRYLSEFLRILKPTGVIYFQLSARPKSALRRLEAWLVPEVFRAKLRALKHLGKPRYRLYWVPREQVVRHVQRGGGVVRSVIPDEAAGPRWESFTYVVTKG